MEQSIIIGLLALTLIAVILLFFKQRSQSPSGGSDAALTREIELLKEQLGQKDDKIKSEQAQVNERSEEIRRMEGQLGEARIAAKNAKEFWERSQAELEEINLSNATRKSLSLMAKILPIKSFRMLSTLPKSIVYVNIEYYGHYTI